MLAVYVGACSCSSNLLEELLQVKHQELVDRFLCKNDVMSSSCRSPMTHVLRLHERGSACSSLIQLRPPDSRADALVDHLQVDVLIGGVGTGGTITGAGEFLKSQKAGLRVIAVGFTCLFVPRLLPNATPCARSSATRCLQIECNSSVNIYA